MTPLERVARALCANSIGCKFGGNRYPDDHETLSGDPFWMAFLDDAKIAILALLPASEGMVEAGALVMETRGSRGVWKAMIDAALSDGDKGETS